MVTAETLKQVVAQRRADKKIQLETAFIMILSEHMNTYPSIIHKVVNELLKEVSIRTDLR